MILRMDKGTPVTVVAQRLTRSAALFYSREDIDTFLDEIAQGQRLVFRLGIYGPTTVIWLDGSAAAVTEFRERVSRLQ